MIEFNQLVLDLQLQELPLIGRMFTWSNKRPQPSFSKLDKAFLSDHWADLSSHTPYLLDLPTTTSDHAPLGLHFKRIDNLTNRTFQFERYQAGDLLVSIPTFQTTVLQFADDTAIFTPAHVQNIKIIHSILNVFGETSGLKINLTKSGYIPIAIPADLKPIIDSAMQCPRLNLPTQYLGLPLSI
jgi:hypothetical protein